MAELVLFSEEEDDVLIRRDLTRRLMAAWVARLPLDPDPRTRGKNAAAAKWLAENYSERQIRYAARGMGRLYPYSEGRPWDLMDLKKHFVRAFMAEYQDDSANRRAEIVEELGRIDEAGAAGQGRLRGGVGTSREALGPAPEAGR